MIIHPVDNLLGPILVGSALRMHTLLMFFSVSKPSITPGVIVK